MIARLWHGVTPVSCADEYVQYLSETGVRGVHATPGNQGVLVLRRTDEAHADFLFTSFWESWDAIRRFAGDDVERARYYPRDQEFLVTLEPGVTHYEVVRPTTPDLAAAYAHILRPLG